MEASFSLFHEYLQSPSVPPKYYLNSRGHAYVVPVDGSNKRELKLLLQVSPVV